jgi:hypothetical protein
MTPHTEAFYVGVPKHGPRFELIDRELSDLALHLVRALPLSKCFQFAFNFSHQFDHEFSGRLGTRIESNLKAAESKRRSAPDGERRPLTVN